MGVALCVAIAFAAARLDDEDPVAVKQKADALKAGIEDSKVRIGEGVFR